jgi:GNAT superfamily N-acetyltransferase
LWGELLPLKQGGIVLHTKPETRFTASEFLLLNEKASRIRELFCVDQATRRALGGPPHTKNILQELMNAQLEEKGLLRPRARQAIGIALLDKKEQLAGYASFTIISKGTLTAYEKRYVWDERGPENIRGIFLKRIVVDPKARRDGIAKELIAHLRRVGDEKGMHCYADVMGDNIPMRSLATSTGGLPNMFWHTPQDIPMVRYIWM